MGPSARKSKENTEALATLEILPVPSSAAIASLPSLHRFSKRKSELPLEAGEARESKSLKLSPQEELASEALLVKKDRASSSHQKGSKAYECEICEKKFARKWDYHKHMRAHTGEKPFPCTECDKKFSDKSNLTAHMRTHRVERPFPCAECGKKFKHNPDLKRHMLTHTGEQPFDCTQCEKKFTHKSNLTRHMRTHE